MTVTQFRAVCFTDFTLRKWSQNDLKENDIQYVAYALETCPETKKLHHQAWAYSEKKKLVLQHGRKNSCYYVATATSNKSKAHLPQTKNIAQSLAN
jgi:4-hydroxy-3-methylbut-2-enyl diphosphate reductase IspH